MANTSGFDGRHLAFRYSRLTSDKDDKVQAGHGQTYGGKPVKEEIAAPSLTVQK